MQDQNGNPLFPPNDAPAAPGGNVSMGQPVNPILVDGNPQSNSPIVSAPMPTQPVVAVPVAPIPQDTFVPSTISQVEPQPLPPIEPQIPVQSVIPRVQPTISNTPQTSSILTPPVTQSSPPLPTVAPAMTTIGTSPPPIRKGKLPKILLFIALGVLITSGLVFAVMKFLGSGRGLTGKAGELTWWGVDVDEDAAKTLIADYQLQHPDIKITFVKQSPQEYRERLTNALAKGDGPDIFEIHNSWPAMFKNDLAVLPSTVMGKEEYASSFYPVIATDMTTSKGIVGIPLSYDAITLYVNEDIFSSALKTPPKTWIEVQDLADASRGITQKDQAGRIIQSAIALGTTDNIDYWPEVFGLMMYQNKASFTKLDSTTTKDVFTFYQYFSKTAGAWDSSLPNSTTAFAKQKTAMIFAPGRAAFDIIQQDPTLHFKTYPLPQLPKESPTDPDFAYATYWVESVWTKSANKDTAWSFLKFMSSPESLQKINQTLKSNSKTQHAYPRPTLNAEFVNDPILGSIVALAQSAKSWYLADKTNDGTTGINTQLKGAYTKALANDATTAQTEVSKILNQYGIAIQK